MPQGDMPGDAVHISEAHRTKADAIFPLLLPQLAEICARNPYGRAVITVCGGSGSGKQVRRHCWAIILSRSVSAVMYSVGITIPAAIRR